MRSLRKVWWAALASSALMVGCGTEETTSTSTPTPSPSPAPTPSPAPAPTPTPAEKKDEAPKAETPKVEAPKAETPKVDAPKAETPKVDAPKTEAPKVEGPKADASKLSTEEIAEIKKLPAAEQELAMKQLTCPVSGEHLGSMDVPVKVTAEGKSFYLCCKGCKKDVEADPKAVIAKLTK